jgi:hypothetical protein
LIERLAGRPPKKRRDLIRSLSSALAASLEQGRLNLSVRRVQHDGKHGDTHAADQQRQAPGQ